jgi:demethylmenaquinone methyltransferase/2-methoxy-6-polyprenyl-1,4-benzoquinol methylase
MASGFLTVEQDATMRAYYNQRAAEYDEWYLRRGHFAVRPHTERWHAEVALLRERVAQFGHGRLLEIAAGTGWWTEHLARRAKVTTVDYAPAMLAQLQLRLRRRGLLAASVRADAYALPLAAAAFDCGFAGFWLSHVPYARLPEFLNEVRRVLQHGGQVMIVDSARTEPKRQPGVEYFQERILNDGLRHQVLKIWHTPQTLATTLAPLGRVVDVWETGMFFVGAIVAVE